MIFWRILDSKLYEIGEVDKLGFEESIGLRIPDKYLEDRHFTVCRTCHGLGDWSLLSAMPRLLKTKFPDCTVVIPSEKLLRQLFGHLPHMWSGWSNPFKNADYIFRNNPYVDSFSDFIKGDVFTDHYHVYDKNKPDIPLLEMMLKFWSMTPDEYADSAPELYFSDEEKEMGDAIISEYTDGKFGTLLISNRFKEERDAPFMLEVLRDNDIPYFYYSSTPLSKTTFNHIQKALDFRNMPVRIQLYIKTQAELVVGNQCGVDIMMPRYTKTYMALKSSDNLGSNFVRGQLYTNTKKNSEVF